MVAPTLPSVSDLASQQRQPHDPRNRTECGQWANRLNGIWAAPAAYGNAERTTGITREIKTTGAP
jgi:hypothetical protein